MAQIKFNTTVESKAKNPQIIPIKDGQFLIVTDTYKLIYDFGTTRIELSDIIDLDTEAQRIGLLTPLSKFYFVKETAALWRYDGEWKNLSSGGGSSDFRTGFLLANNWSNGQQTVTVDGLGADQNGVIGITQDISGVELEAVCNAGLYVCGQAADELTLACSGDTPTCDIPFAIILLG